MSQKLLGRIRLVDQQITVERTDATDPSGPHTIDIPNGEYFVLGRGFGRVTVGGTGTSITLASGHGLEVGDVVAVRDVSGGVWTTTTATVTASTALSVKLDGSITVQVNDIIVVAADLLGVILAVSIEPDVGAMAYLGAEVSSAGIVSFTSSNASAEYEITFDTSELQSILRFEDDLTAANSTLITSAASQAGDRMCGYTMFLSRVLVEELPVSLPQKSVSIADSNRVETHHYATRTQLQAEVVYEGGPHASNWEEYHAVDDFWDDVIGPGRPIRLYRSVDENQAWVRITNPDGYRTWVCVGPKNHSPPPLKARWYYFWKEAWTLQLHTVASGDEGPQED